MLNHDQLLALWAKTDREQPTSGRYHPLPCHLLDVAAVADAMWRLALTPAVRRRVGSGLGLDEATAGRWVAFLAGLHDIGKASPAFQQKADGARTRLEQYGLRWVHDTVTDPGHGLVTTLALRELLPTHGLGESVADILALAVGGHHGMLPTAASMAAVASSDVRGDEAWTRARAHLCAALSEALGGVGAPPPICDQATGMLLAGLISVADWIGSDTRFFALQNPLLFDARAYGDHAARQARAALAALGWLDWQPSHDMLTFTDLFPGIATPRPAQQLVGQLDGIAAGPGILIVELPMGEGKTEAALYAADRWSAALGQRGVYVAMPTMATSNQMFTRAHDFLARRYSESVIGLQLLHSHAALTIDEEADAPEPPPIVPDDLEDGVQAMLRTQEWFTRRKRGLLAPFGVGTVDQALLAALRTRHVFVRLFGLAGKTVIFDEVHAYDVYMSTLFERLLTWLGALGSSVVILSATLPAARRRALVDAYTLGAGWATLNVPAVAYPRMTWAFAAGADAVSVPTSEQTRRELRLAWVDGRLPDANTDTGTGTGAFPLGERLRAALAQGGCAAVICNTVNRAQQVYAALKPYFPEVADDGLPELDLFHARFVFEDRATREKRALVRFGKSGSLTQDQSGNDTAVRRPFRAVLVATQVIEQSLDLDFDLMVSDFAPVDLLLQRSGRLQRHSRERPPGLQAPALWICLPEEGGADGPDFSNADTWIYDEHVLLRSAIALGERATLRVPEDVAGLIELVYDPEMDCPDAARAPLRARWERTRAVFGERKRQDEAEAQKRWLASPRQKGFFEELTARAREEDAPDFHTEHQALTRLAEPSVGLVCLYQTAAGVAFDPAGRDLVPDGAPTSAVAKRLLRRSVNVSDRRIIQTLLNEQPPARWRRSALLNHQRCALFDAASHATLGAYTLELHPELGLRVFKSEAQEQEL